MPKPNSITNAEGRVCLVTGASRGIGRAVAIELGRNGNRVAVNFNSNETAAREVAQNISDHGGTAKVFQADIRNAEAVEQMINQIHSEWGGVEVLVNNAGITRDNLLLMMKVDEWLDVLTTNLHSLYAITKRVAKDMLRKRWGRIINISSVAANHGGRGQSNYAAAKGGMNGFTISLAGELGKKGITVNAIAPGVIETEMSARVRDLAGEDILKEITLGRFGKPEEIAYLAAFLASEKANYITGQVITVDGGFRL